jgi:hypothetical protein
LIPETKPAHPIIGPTIGLTIGATVGFTEQTMPDVQSAPTLAPGSLRGLLFIYRYRFLTIEQFAKVAGFSYYHSAEILRRFEKRGLLGFFGHVAIPAQGKTPKVYFLTKRGYDVLARESEAPEEIGPFQPVHQEVSWTPQMFHRLRLLDLILSLENDVAKRPSVRIIQTLLEYRRAKGTRGLSRETTDYVSEQEIPQNRIVPDSAFILENTQNSRRALFFLEMDMGTERIATGTYGDPRATQLP